MKFTRNLLATLAAALILGFGITPPTFAQTYPTTTPVYIPSAILSSTALTAAGDVVYTVSGVNTVSAQFLGTHSVLTGTFQVSNDGGTTYVTAAAVPFGGGTPIGAFTLGAANGLWFVNTAGMTNLRVHVTSFTGTSVKVNMTGTAAASALNTDPCQSPGTAKLSAVVNIGAAATTKVVDAVAGKTVYVCAIEGSLAGTTPSITLTSGTHVTNDCDTTPAALSGVILPTSGVIVKLDAGGMTLAKTASGFQFCVTTVGTGSSYQGIATYVQQ